MKKKIKLISGGQTGVDRAALDFAFENGLECGGYCPKGRLAEDGIIDNKYPLVETETESYDERTEMNVLHSGGTLILNSGGALAGGTLYTKMLAETHRKPLLVVDLSGDWVEIAGLLTQWINTHQIATLNVAGPRESTASGIHERAKNFFEAVLLIE